MSRNEQELKDALRALAATGPQEAPADVERVLLDAFRRKQRSRGRVARICGALAGAAVAAGLALMFRIPPQPPKPEARVTLPAPPPVAAAAPEPIALAPKKVAPRQVRTARPPTPSAIVPEVATNFYSLPDADIFAPVEDATVIRVQLPRSAMRMVGLPVNEERAAERIRADVVLGQDGLARAVRFVQ
jgi:hypothetical protein